MRLTLALLKHHKLRQAKATWQVQSKRKVINTGLKEALVKNNIAVVDCNEEVALPRPLFNNLNIIGQGPLVPKPGTIADPNYHEEILLFRDQNVLLEGLEQAKLLTNTIEPSAEHELPAQIKNLIDAVSFPNQNRYVKRCIRASVMFDAEQVKLPKKKDPDRPAWIFPRYFGISRPRKSALLCKKLIQLCETISQTTGAHIFEERLVFDHAFFSVPIKWDSYNVLLDLRADLLVASKSALSKIEDPGVHQVEPYNLGPVKPVVSLEKSNVYQLLDKFPMKSGPQGLQIHTAVVLYDESEVHNLYGTEVLENQILGRNLMKAYSFAVAQARQNYGTKSEGPLPVPVTIQTVQTNGQWFQFSVMQLNTFDMINVTGESSFVRNYFWTSPIINLYSHCDYEEGKPVLSGYNPDVFKTLLAFYNNVM